MRASSQRQGSAWQSWSHLRDATLISMNVSDHNPSVRPGLTPQSSWELSTPQMMKFYVKGGELSGGKSGYIFSNSNWDPYPLANEMEAFTIALTNMGVVVVQRIERFTNPFFTVIKASDVMKERVRGTSGGGYLPVDLWEEMTGYANPVTPQGQPIVATVEDLEANTRLKVTRARAAVDVGMHLVAQDLLTNAFWMDVRKAQDGSRSFGVAPTAAHAALRKVIPLAGLPGGQEKAPYGQLVYEFMKTTPTSTFYNGGPTMPAGETIPVAGQ
jgi:histidine ammonia-lyase